MFFAYEYAGEYATTYLSVNSWEYHTGYVSNSCKWYHS